MADVDILRTSFVLAVPDAMSTGRWWMETMKFERLQDHGDWVFVSRGRCTVMLGSCTDIVPVRELGDHQYFGYVEVDDLDAYRAQICPAEGDFSEPEDKPWGMREMLYARPTDTV